jgi:hypothetical protein
MHPNSEIGQVLKTYLTLEIVKQDQSPKYILPCPTHYYIYT